MRNAEGGPFQVMGKLKMFLRQVSSVHRMSRLTVLGIIYSNRELLSTISRVSI